MEKETVVMFPVMGIGHLTPMLELANLLALLNFSVIILIVKTPSSSLSSPVTSSFLSRISSSLHPSISFHHLPNLPSLPLPTFQLLPHSNPLLSDFLKPLIPSIRALVLDMFCTAAFDVADDLDIPAYLFYPSPASALSAFISVPPLISQMTESFKDLGDRLLHFPGLPPIPASHLPTYLMDRDGESCKGLVYHFERFTRANGIIINTFERLEPRAVKALLDDCPPIYCIGPLIGERTVGSEEEEEEKHECLAWLGAQPKGSVVFLCFGSIGGRCFSRQQLKEIAEGLERSRQRFLWAVGDDVDLFDQASRMDFSDGTSKTLMAEGRGMAVRSWAPQKAVLRHESAGGFVSHCGWNSVLEAVSAGVPMIAWPLYAEQRLNKVFLVEEARIAVEMEGYDEEMVSAEEVETKVRWLMESEGGRELRDRAKAMKESAAGARRDGGSSDKAWREFASAMMMSDGRRLV